MRTRIVFVFGLILCAALAASSDAWSMVRPSGSSGGSVGRGGGTGARPYWLYRCNGVSFSAFRWVVEDSVTYPRRGAGASGSYCNVTNTPRFPGVAVMWGCAAPSNVSHTAYLGGDGSCHRGEGFPEDTWWRFKMMIPAGQDLGGATTVQGAEFHVDSTTQEDLNTAFGPGVRSAYSNWLGLRFADAGGRKPRICAHFSGGPYSETSYWRSRNDVYFDVPRGRPGNPLRYNHWYDIVWHLKWGSTLTPGDRNQGYVQLWIDGVKVYDKPTYTQYVDDIGVNRHGRLSYGTEAAFAVYRSGAGAAASWPSSYSIGYDEIQVGRTAASIGFARKRR